MWPCTQGTTWVTSPPLLPLLVLSSARSPETQARLRELRNTPKPQEHKVLVLGHLPGGVSEQAT